MSEQIRKLITKLLNPKGRLDCGAAFRIAAKLGVEVGLVSDEAERMGVKIDNCELGQFGGLENGRGKYTVMTQLKQMTDEKDRILCKDARDAAAGVGLKTIRSTLKDYKIDVKYCQLGCFKEKKGKKMRVKTKIWIENDEGELIFGKGKTEVLDVIAEVGSISKAAEILGMNYKKCWTHLQILQKNLKEELFTTRQGGGENAGTTLNERAHELINAYRQLQNDIEDFADKRFKELFLKKDGEKNDAAKDDKKDKNK